MPRKESVGYKTLKQRGIDKDYELVDPLDYLLLDALPAEGELVMGYYPFAKSAEELVKNEFKDLELRFVAFELRNLAVQGLAVRPKTRSKQRNAYQRTAEGTRVLEEWKKNQAPDKSGGEGEK